MSGAPRRAIDRAEAALARIDALGRGQVAAAVLVGAENAVEMQGYAFLEDDS